ncbi:hypothetical protein H9L05_13965 [Hymenobacter qilianensis]|uniref:Right-handed parallel beta-helix repeat-containing protein n=1 Tax=Hymenobacter qilianensis TaxID=1385715 RepID=A0A7H0GSC6_9BACT|nr:hypothetical protein [Hymenobacter qilianensis]QNP51192.1 hypothetical protein H9L05_13965 [Hymenobacter qilianensis]
MDKTVLRYGYNNESGIGLRLNPGVKTTGFADLTIENISDGGQWSTNLSASGIEEFFMQRVRWKLNIGRWLDIADANKVCIVNCDFTQGITATTGYRGPLRMDGSKNVVYADNKIVYANDGLHFGHTRANGGAQNIVFENNKTYRDGSARWPGNARVITHVTTWDFARNVAILNNTFQVINGRPQNTNDGETILAEQGANYVPDESIGTVTSATSNTLTDNTKSWGSLVQPRVGVGIVQGKGMGQWRQITSRTGTTLTLKSNWEVIPDHTSRYAVWTWGAENWLVQGNVMEGNQRGIMLSQNANHDIAIVGNTLTNNGSIDIAPFQRETTNWHTTVGMYPTWNIQIVKNSVSDLNGEMGVFIGVHPTQHIQQKPFGTLALGVEMRNNSLTAHTPMQ